MMNDMNDPISGAVSQNQSMLDKVKAFFNPKQWMETISNSRDTLVEMGMYLGIGFLVGFLLKKYSKYLIIVLLCIGGLVVLQQFEVVSIVFNAAKLQEVFGIKQSTMNTDMFSIYLDWIKLNFSIVLSFSIGFLFGLKVA